METYKELDPQGQAFKDCFWNPLKGNSLLWWNELLSSTVLPSLADLCLIGWSCSAWLQATPLVTGGWVKPKPSSWPAMLCLTCFFLLPHLGHSPPHSTPVTLAGIGSCPCPTAPTIRAFPYSAPSLQWGLPPSLFRYQLLPKTAPLGIFLETSMRFALMEPWGLPFKVLITVGDLWFMWLCD